MNPVRTDKTNFTYKLPGGSAENDLPCEAGLDEAGLPVITSTWELSVDELMAIQLTRRIELHVWGGGHHPVALSVVKA